MLMLVATVGLTACANDPSVGRFKVGKPYTIKGQTYYPEENYTHTETGLASWYGPGFHGKKTANGERFDEDEFTAAHKTLQLPSLVRVTNLENGRSVVVRVTDRGPFHGNRIIDLSKGAARELDFLKNGTAKVMIQVLGPESMALAEAAKRKIDTKGAEIAVNETGSLDERFAAFYPSEFSKAMPSDAVQVASNEYMRGSDADFETVRPAYQPQTAVERAVAWNPRPQPTIPAIETISPSAGYAVTASGTPLPPQVPPAKRNESANDAAITRTRGLPRHPSIPVATLDPADVVPKPANYNASASPAYYVQAGSYTTQGNAERAAGAVASYGPYRIVSATLGGQPYYRLRIGPFESVEKADALVDTLRRQGRQAAVIVAGN